MIKTIILIFILILVIGGAILYIRKESKKGIKCVGCPYAQSCGGDCSSEVKKK